MTKVDMSLSTRPLTPDDQPLVTELVRRVDPDDWVLQELDLFLNGPGPDGIRGYGGYGIQLPGGQLAGIGLLDFTRPGEAYLGGLRVPTELQNQGYGTWLTHELLVLAAHHGGQRAWMVSALDNLRMHRVAEKVGFARVGEWRVWIEPEVVAPPSEGPAARRMTPDDSARLANWLKQHPPGEEGLTTPDYTVWDPTRLEPEDFTAWLAAGELAVAEHCGVALGVAACHWGDDDPLTLRVRYLRGTAPAVGSLLAWMQDQCRSRPSAVMALGLPGPQAAVAQPWIGAASDNWIGYVFMRPLDDLQGGCHIRGV